MLAPVLTQAQQQQWQQQAHQQVQQESQQWAEVAQIVGQAEQHYMATPEGQGYNERLTGYETAMRTALNRSGMNDDVTNKLVNEQLKGFSLLGMALNVPPPVLLDNYINAVMEFAMQYKGMGGNGQRSNGNGYRQQQRQVPQGRMSPQVQVARMATQSGAVGAPPTGAAGGNNGSVTAADLLGRGLTGKDIDGLIKEHGSIDKMMKYLDRVGVELEEIGG